MAADQFAFNLNEGGNRQYHAFNATFPPPRVDWPGQGGKMYPNFNQPRPPVVPQQYQQSFVFTNAGPLQPQFQQQQFQPQLMFHQLPPPPAPVMLPISAPAYTQQQHNQHHNQQYNQQYTQQQHHQQATSPGQQAKQPQQRHKQPKPRLRVPDGKILILFDLNGVLTDHTPARQEGRYMVRDHVVRPQIEVLLRLLPHFTLGIYSSATRKTVNAALAIIHKKLREAAAAKGLDGSVVPPIHSIFPIICDRSNCQMDPHWQNRADGQEWDTIKPLARLGFDLRRTILVDNDHYKSAGGEADNMFLMPHWEQDPVSDRDLPILVELLLQRLKNELGDVRPHLEPMRQTLVQLRQQPQEHNQPQQQQQGCDQLPQQHGAGSSQYHTQAEQQSPPAAAAAAMLVPSPAKVDQHMLHKTLAYKGYQVGSFDLYSAPKNVRQLIQVLTQYAASDAAAPANTSGTAAVDIAKLLAGVASNGSSSSSEALVAAASATYQQHVANVLLAAVWAAGFCAPEVVTFDQVLRTLSCKGLPTDCADRMCDIMIRRGDVVLHPSQQQQQQQNPQFPWPLEPGYWPAGSGSTAAAYVGQQQQQVSGSSLIQCAAPPRRVKTLNKAAATVRDLISKGPSAVEAVLTGFGTKPLQPGDEGYLDRTQQQLPAAAAASSDTDIQEQQGAAAQWPAGRRIQQVNPVLTDLRNVLLFGFKDLGSRRGVLLEQLMLFVQGLKPEIAQQILGNSSEQQQQRLRSSLEDLAAQQVQCSLLHPEIPSNVRQCDAVLGLLLDPWSEDISVEPARVAASLLAQQQQQQQPEDSTASPLVRYFSNVVPDAAAVTRSLEVLALAAAAAASPHGSQALLDQLWQQLLLPAALAVPDLQLEGLSPDVRVREVVDVMNIPLRSRYEVKQELLLEVSKAMGYKGSSKRYKVDAFIQQKMERHLPQPQEEQQPPPPPLPPLLLQDQQWPPPPPALLQDRQQQQQPPLPHVQEAQQPPQLQNHQQLQQPGISTVGAGLLALLPVLPGEDQHQQQFGLRQVSNKRQQPSLPSQEQQQRLGINAGGVLRDATAMHSSPKRQRIEQQPGMASEFWLDQQQTAAAADEVAAAEEENMNNSELDRSMDGSDASESGTSSSGDGSSSDDDSASGSGDDGSSDGSGGSSGDGNEDDHVDDQEGIGDDGDEDDHDGDSGADLPSDEEQGLAGATDEEGFDQALEDAEAMLESLCNAEKGKVSAEAEAALDDLYTADELAVAQGRTEGEDEETGWVTDDEGDGYNEFDDNAHDAQLQLGITSIEDAGDLGTTAAASAAAAQKQQSVSKVPGGRPLHAELAAAAAAVASGAQQQQAVGSSTSDRKSGLHHELLVFAAAAAPSAVERLVLDCALSQLQRVAREIWPTAEAVLFGSQATGLALPGSDLDVVLLNTPGPKTKNAAEGYAPRDRMTVRKLLYKLRGVLYKRGFAKGDSVHIIDARVPLCKGPMSFTIPQSELAAAIAADEATGAAMHCPVLATVARDAVPRTGSRRAQNCVEVSLPVDLSLGVANGAAAVDLMTQQVLALPPLRPLVLVVKALLKEAGLNEVFTGGLSSYSLVNMVVAHLQAEGMTAARMSSVPVISQDKVQQHLRQLAASAAAAAGSSNAPQQQQQWDLGCLLHGFFLRFGEIFDYKSEAVSVRSGGLIPKRFEWKMPAPLDVLLAVEDPQQFGRDISSASRAIKEVKDAFAWAADSVKRMVQYYEGSDDGRQQLAAAAQQLLRKDTAGGSSSGNASAAAVHSTDMTGLTDEERWAAVQAEGQSLSVPDTVVQQYQQQQQGKQQQQQYEAGYVMLSKLIDIFGALGRGAAADARRQQLIDAAAAARKARVKQQVKQMKQQGVKVKKAAAKSSLKVVGLDQQPAGHQVNKAAAAAAKAEAPPKPQAPAKAQTPVKAQPAAAAAANLSSGPDVNAPQVQKLLELFGGTFSSVAAAASAHRRGDLVQGLRHCQEAESCFGDSVEPALAAAAAAADDELLMLLCVDAVSKKIRKVTSQLLKVALIEKDVAEHMHAKPRRSAAVAAAAAIKLDAASAAAELGGNLSAAAAADGDDDAKAALMRLQKAAHLCAYLQQVHNYLTYKMRNVRSRTNEVKIRIKQQSDNEFQQQQQKRVLDQKRNFSHDLVQKAYVIVAGDVGVDHAAAAAKSAEKAQAKAARKAARKQRRREQQQQQQGGNVAPADAQQQGGAETGQNLRQQLEWELRRRREAAAAAAVTEGAKPAKKQKLTRSQRRQFHLAMELNGRPQAPNNRKRPKSAGSAGGRQQQQGSPGGAKRQRRGAAAARGGGGRGWSHD